MTTHTGSFLRPVDDPPELPPVRVLLDPADDIATLRAVRTLHDRSAGRIVVEPTPATTGLTALARDLFVALDKDPPDPGRPAVAQLWAMVTAWMTGHRIEEIILTRAHRQSPDRLARMVALSADTGASLSLLWHGQPPADWHEVLPETTTAVLDDLPQVMEQARTARPPHPQPAPRPLYCPALSRGPDHAFARTLRHLPEMNVAGFRAALRRECAPEVARAADALYTHAMDAACAYLSGHPDYDWTVLTGIQDGMPPEQRFPLAWPDQAGTVSFLIDLVLTSPSPSHTIALLRGAQAGLLRHGILLELPEPLGDSHGPGFPPTPLPADLAQMIDRKISHPVQAAALLIAAFTGLHDDQLKDIRVQDAAEDGSSIALGRTIEQITVAVPVAFREIVTAARAHVIAENGITTASYERLLSTGTGVDRWKLAEAQDRLGVRVLGESRDWMDRDWYDRLSAVWVAEPIHSNTDRDPGQQKGCHASRP